jgi:diguanylate cyclase (GGDEF)-like protein
MKEKKMLKLRIGVVIAVLLCLGIIIFFASKRIEAALAGEMQKTLEDVATQNIIAVNKEVAAKYKLLLALSREVENRTDDIETFLDEMSGIVDVYQFKRIGYVDSDGVTHTTDGYEQDLSYREFYQQSMMGNTMITDAMEDSIGDLHELINVFSVPVYNEDHSKVQGVLFATYQTENFKDILNVECFDGQGYGCILDSSGNIMVNSSDDGFGEENDLFAALESKDNRNKKAIEQIQESNRQGISCTGMIYLDKEEYFYYTSLNHQINESVQWYFMSLVPAKVLEQRFQPVQVMINVLTVIIFAVAVIGVAIYVFSYHWTKRRLLKLAYVDPLTNGWNYEYFKEKMNDISKKQGQIIAMDINDFKIVNSTCGIEMGDLALRNIWDVLKKSLKNDKEFAAHVNADRFALYLATMDRKELIRRIDGMTHEIEAISDELNIPRIIPAFGIYSLEKDGKLEKCYGRAMEAQHLIKGRRDRNYAFYNEVNVERMEEEREMEDSFEEAMERKMFEVWYQPKFSVDNYTVVGAEALIRWRKEDGSLWSPGKFIPLFEKNGMISTLDEYIFREVCRQQEVWEKEGKKMFPVSVNISRASLYFGDIVDKYKGILEQYTLDSRYIELEITESATINNSEIASLIEKFHEAGFHVLLDDFGNGYSSLASLNVMHFDTLKLDKSLIDYIGDKNGETLLYYITRLAQTLGLTITAEGVETKEQVEFIHKLQCTDIQGFYFSKPLPVDEYEKLISK